MRYAIEVCVSISMSCLQFVSFPSQQHATHASSHHACVSCVVFLPTLPTVDGTENRVFYCIQMDIRYVSCLLSFLSVFRCWRGPG